MKIKKNKKEYMVVLVKPLITFTRKDRAKKYINTANKLIEKEQSLYLIKKEGKEMSIIK